MSGLLSTLNALCRKQGKAAIPIMGQKNNVSGTYFPFAFPLSDQSWDRFGVLSLLPAKLPEDLADPSFEIRKLADAINQDPARSSEQKPALPAETLLALRTLNQALRHVAKQYFTQDNPGSLERSHSWARTNLGQDQTEELFLAFVELFPPLAAKVNEHSPAEFLQTGVDELSGRDQATLEMLLLFLNMANPAAKVARDVFDDQELRHRASFVPFITGLEEFLEENEAPGSEGESIFHMLRSPMLASPNDLAGQIEHIRRHWGHLLPADLVQKLALALDVLQEVDTFRLPEFGPPPVLEFGPDSPGAVLAYEEPEAFSSDAAWMSNVVLMAKSVHVWLDQLGRWYQRPIHTLADIPDQELDRLSRFGITGLWLIGLWERSDASRLIKQYMGNPDAAASAYALKDYHIARELGGQEAYEDLRGRAEARGIRLASDMVPNHMGIDSRWLVENPQWFLQTENPPFPAYKFTGGDLCSDAGVSVRIEDGYWNHSDAAVVFQRVDNNTGHTAYIYHGNDGTSMPWNDTAQLNFLLPEVREAVIQVILQVARMFPIIRFDAAMTLAKKHYHRLWFPQPGDAGAIPSRAEHGLSKPDFDQVFPVEFWREVVDRVAAEVPDTLLLAEAFWLMEGYFVRTLGMHRVYNSAFMNMLKMEDNQKYRQTIKNVLEFSPAILQRFVNFMNNPDEKTAVEQFGKGDKYFGCALMLVTMPGLPMLGHGQIEGFSEKYGMEYRRAQWDEHIDPEMVQRHEREIFPLMRRRSLFSGADHFHLFDFQSDAGFVDENVFAYSNKFQDQRGLIIFNNSYESTSGRLQTSCAVNTGSADEPFLQQNSLAQALDLPEESSQWCLFRDQIEGLEYIRSCRELTKAGFHTNLQGYQYRALLDFRFTADSDGQWAHLAEHLAGSGVPSLERALRRMQLSPAVNRLRTWVAPEVMAWFESLWVAESTSEKEEPDWPFPELSSVVSEELVPRLASLRNLYATEPLGPKTKLDFMEMMDRIQGSRLLQAIYLSQGLQQLPGSWNPELELEMQGCTLTQADEGILLQELTAELEIWTGHPFAAWSTVTLATLLVSAQDDLPKMAQGRVDWLLDKLPKPALRQYLGVNEHQGQLWLRKESLEVFLDAMTIYCLVTDPPENPANLLDSRAVIAAKAEKANYEMDRFRKEFIVPRRI